MPRRRRGLSVWMRSLVMLYAGTPMIPLTPLARRMADLDYWRRKVLPRTYSRQRNGGVDAAAPIA